MLISVKLLTKYVIIIYALGSVHEKFGVWIKAVPKSLQRRNSRPGRAKRTAEPFQIEIGVPNWFKRRTFHVLNWCIRFGSWKIRRLNRALLYFWFLKPWMQKSKKTSSRHSIAFITNRLVIWKPDYVLFSVISMRSPDIADLSISHGRCVIPTFWLRLFERWINHYLADKY